LIWPTGLTSLKCKKAKNKKNKNTSQTDQPILKKSKKQKTKRNETKRKKRNFFKKRNETKRKNLETERNETKKYLQVQETKRNETIFSRNGNETKRKNNNVFQTLINSVISEDSSCLNEHLAFLLHSHKSSRSDVAMENQYHLLLVAFSDKSIPIISKRGHIPKAIDINEWKNNFQLREKV
jgi:hypothetical protein